MIRALVLSTLFVGACAKNAFAEEWPFKDPQDVATFTTSSVISGKEPILYVTHDDDDGAWQFHSGEPLTDAQPKVASLSEIVKLDSSVKELADLPRGWEANRKSRGDKWVRSAQPRD